MGADAEDGRQPGSGLREGQGRELPVPSGARTQLAESLESCSTEDWTWQPGTATIS